MTYDKANGRRSIRLANWDYRERGAYFVTICTHERAVLFEDERFAAIARKAWLRLIKPGAHIEHGDFVLMPNHVHGIIWLTGATTVGAQRRGGRVAPSLRSASGARVDQAISHGAAPLRPDGTPISVLPGSLGGVVRGYKSFTTNRINRVRGTAGAPVWQRNYYERVIRDERELEAVRAYILDNPRRWAEDKYYPANLLLA